MPQESQTNRQKLKFKFTHEGYFAFKSSVFELSITSLPLSEKVGLARELIFPIFELASETFPFLMDSVDGTSIEKYRGFSRELPNSTELLRLECRFSSSKSKNDTPEVSSEFDKILDSKFEKYEQGSIFHTTKWVGSDRKIFNGKKFSVEEFLMGAGIYIQSLRFGVEEFEKYGLGYRWFNVPSKRASFELKIENELNLYFRVSKGVGEEFLEFFFKTIEALSNIFSLDESAQEKFKDVKQIAQSYLI